MAAFSIFMSPWSIAELKDLRTAGIDIPGHLTNVMLHKQLVRARLQGKEPDIADFRSRASDAVNELRAAPSFDYVLVNHDGEGEPTWHLLPDGNFTGGIDLLRPEGSAGRALQAFVDFFLRGETAGFDNPRAWKNDTP